MAEQGLHEDVSAKLLAWYDAHARNLPWRAKRGIAPDPYHVWLSEIMLQQTTVAAVRDYYIKFLSRWPTVSDLAKASQEDVLRAWAGLGYYARARNLHACATRVVSDWKGKFPDTEEALRTLPGVGPYTAAAIAAIAFDRPHAAVDGNVERVMARVYAIETPLPASKPLIKLKAQALVPRERAGDFAQAMMDLGATICTPRIANCAICPWTDDCEGSSRGIAESLPRKAPKAKIPTRRGIAFWVERDDGHILLRQRPQKGLLGGMMEIPSTPWEAKLPCDIVAPVESAWSKLKAPVEHTFTHFHLQLSVWKTATAEKSLPDGGGYRWVHKDELNHEALPSLMRKVAAVALK
ncbi:MAG: A/G-specific adenine glycosylase [Aestuariivirga sp.]|nr:A/G-specific adenine glycosylase [Aestuariivirga sp.]